MARQPTGQRPTQRSRILRPVAADGHDAKTFPDLIPDSTTGQITYDVDNDGDGVPDSVWLDLGYSARADSTGRLYKPLFAFMVIGLNGRIPLNTAGNLAGSAAAPVVNTSGAPTDGSGGDQAQHLGNSISEIDPTYALQNGMSTATNIYNKLSYYDPIGAFAPPQSGITDGKTTIYANNTQVDNGGIDVRLTQLRNLVAGTRPQNNPLSIDTTTNGDSNYVNYLGTSNYVSTATGPPTYGMPNGVADLNTDTGATDGNGNFYVTRTTLPVPGRWGESQSIPGNPILNPYYTVGGTGVASQQYVSVVTSNYANPVRAGYSLDIGDVVNGVPRDAADDNNNSYDPYPLGHTGEVGDSDFYDAAGALLLPVDRMRRWLAPADINGTGRVRQWQITQGGPDRGGDSFGRVEYQSYFRPPGSPGVLNTTTNTTTPQTGSSMNGVISYGSWSGGAATAWTSGTQYQPDVTNNALHGFESFRFPNQTYAANSTNAYTVTMTNPSNNTPGSFTPQSNGGVPVDYYVDVNNMPQMYQTYDFGVNSAVHSDGVNETEELNLYTPNPLLDSPFGPADLEWLYRQQDVDGSSLTSRLSSLAPVSFTNSIDGQRRRRLFAIDSWDTNNFIWTNDNPGGASRITRLSARASARGSRRPVSRRPAWPSATRRSTLIIRYPCPTTPTSRYGRNGSTTPISS